MSLGFNKLERIYIEKLMISYLQLQFRFELLTVYHCFKNRTGSGGRTVKTGNRDKNRFFKPKEPDFLLIP